VLERKPPFSPDDVTKEFAATIRAYGIASVRGDRYGGMWPRERFAQHGFDYTVSDKVKSDIYLSMLPLLNSGRVELLDNPRLTTQLCSLERKTARGGKDSVDHAPSAHDDLINAAAGALVAAAQRASQQLPIVPPIIGYRDGTTSDTSTADTRSSTEKFYDYGGAADWGPVSTGNQYWGPV